MPLPGLKARSLILTTLHLSPHFRGHPESPEGGFEGCQRAPLVHGDRGVGAVPPSAAAAGTSVVWLFYAKMTAKNFEGINWIFSKLVAFRLEKYCESKSENEQFNAKKKKKGNLEGIAKNNTFSPSLPRDAIRCALAGEDLGVCWHEGGSKGTRRNFVTEQSLGTDVFYLDFSRRWGRGAYRRGSDLKEHMATRWCPNYRHTGFVAEGPSMMQRCAAEMRLSTCNSPPNTQSPHDLQRHCCRPAAFKSSSVFQIAHR